MEHSIDSNVPCIDCITKAMCIARLNGKCMMDLMALVEKCSIAKAYVHQKGGTVQLVADLEEVLCKNIEYSPEPF